MMWSFILGLLILWLVLGVFLVKAKQPKRVIITFMSVVIVSSLALYSQWGGMRQVKAEIAYEAMVETLQSLYDTPNLDVETVEVELAVLEQSLPEHPFLWFRLGEIYEKLAWYDKAKQSYQHSLNLAPEVTDTKIKLAYAQSLSEGGILDQNSIGLVQSILRQDSNHLAALNLLAMDAYKKDNYQTAAQIWQRMLDIVAPNDVGQYTAINKALEKAKQHLTRNELVSFDNEILIKVNVSISEQLYDKIPPNASLFVFAKQKQGKGPPLAAVKLDSKTLPKVVTLSKTDAMMGGVTLAMGQDIIITARITQSEGPFSQKGDIEGKSKLIHISGTHDVDIIIDELVG